jgi:hypothetical protein
MADFDEYFPSKWLKASDLDGKTVKAVISKIVPEEMGQAKEKKLVAYFQGKEKGLTLNKTKCALLQDTFGKSIDGCVGQAIEMSPGRTQFKGEIVDCINIRCLKTAKKAAKAEPVAVAADGDDDSVPF